MQLKDLKEWINSLPEEFLEFDVVNGEMGVLDDDYYYRVDKPVVTLTIDEDSKEVVILNDSEIPEEELQSAYLETLKKSDENG